MCGLRRFPEAEALLDDAVSRFPDNFWLLRTRALVVRAQGDDIEAYTRCRALRQSFPDNPTAHADLAHLMLDLKQLPVAEAETKASLALFPDHRWLLHMYARCADLTADTAAAADRWTNVLIHHPDHEAGYAAAVRALVGVGRLDEAAGIATEGLSLFPNGSAAREACDAISKVPSTERATPTTDSAEALLATALGAERNGRWADAAWNWGMLRTQAPALALAYASGARALLRANRVAEAEMVLAKARRDLPHDAGVLEAWAEAAFQRNAFDAALARYRTLQRAFAAAPHADLGIARALHASGRLDEANAAYARLSEEQPLSVFVAQQYALVAIEHCDWPEAIRRLTTMTSKFPGHLPAYRQKADALVQAGRAEEADAVLCDAVSRFPDDLETALRWAASGGRDSGSDDHRTRLDVVCGRFPDVAPAIRAHRTCPGSEPALVLATSQ
jgi:predicted Zn-dependent protease